MKRITLHLVYNITLEIETNMATIWLVTLFELILLIKLAVEGYNVMTIE